MRVMADDHHGAFERIDRLNKGFAGNDIQMVGRLIQQENMGLVAAHHRKQQSRLFTAREIARMRVSARC